MDSAGPNGDIHDPLIGEMIGRYRVEKRIGQGGMGAVYELLQPAIHKRMALKLLHEEYASRSEIVQRFFDEARAVNLIGHPNIVDITDFGHLPDGRPFIIMEYLQGESLEDYLSDSGVLGENEALAILEQVCSALGAAHAKHIVHRDLKPENIFLVRTPHQPMRAKVLDFGIAKLREKDGGNAAATQTGVVLGTPTYMSPEQAQGNTNDADHRTDIYSLGAVLFQMLTGAPPFTAKTFPALIFKHISEAPPKVHERRPNVREAWSRIVDKALSKAPEDRYQSMADLLDDVKAALPPEPLAATNIVARPSEQANPTGTLPEAAAPKRSPLLPIAAAGVAGAVAVGAWLATRDAPKPEDASGPALVDSTHAKASAEPGDVQNTSDTKNSVPSTSDTTHADHEPSGVPVAAPPDAAVAPAPVDAGIPASDTSEPEEVLSDADAKPSKGKARGKATLTVLSDSWTYVYLDGKNLGTTPIPKIEVPAGAHKLRLKNGSTGEFKTIRLQLKKSKLKTVRHNWR